MQTVAHKTKLSPLSANTIRAAADCSTKQIIKEFFLPKPLTSIKNEAIAAAIISKKVLKASLAISLVSSTFG